MAYFLLAFKIKMLTPAICLLVIWSPNLWGRVWTYLSDCWYSFISFRPWQTWSSPTWSPTSHVPVNWPCAVRCAPTPPAERRNPSSPTRSSHRNSRHTFWCSRATCGGARGLLLKSFIQTHKPTTPLQQECQLTRKCHQERTKWFLQMYSHTHIYFRFWSLDGTNICLSKPLYAT